MLTITFSANHRSAHRRAIAAAVVVLLLAAQLIAAAHVHRSAWTDTYSKGAQASAGDAACPICLFHAHAPASTADGAALVRPLEAHGLVVTAMPSRLLFAPKPQRFGRAPPVSA